MTDDQKLSALLTECMADLDLRSADGMEGMKALLRQIEAQSPGEIEAMAARLQLHRLKRTTAH